MKWSHPVSDKGYTNKMGLVSPPYSIGKYSVGNSLAYRLWFNNDLLGQFKSFEECEKKMNEHLTSLKESA